MKIINVKSIIFPEIKVVTVQRFVDERGFFTELYKKSDLINLPELDFLKGFDLVQANLSYSKKKVFRGLHFQWDPYVEKLVRVPQGHIVDFFLDIRKNSLTYGKIGAYEMRSEFVDATQDWIYLPKGFAHGCYFLADSSLEYFCSGEYNPKTEAGITVMDKEIDWSLCDPFISDIKKEILESGSIISEKDKKGLTLSSWTKDPNSEFFK
ncbi:dTDP-4-keto-6-deoxy-D-glucose epimerase [Candidatus Roizmanbacteria bacterium]|nr:dTDP-4-keto-6-deoxy-D-glucose epimerase [Candidatus Roizmanbacteria bacterium]